MSERHQKQGPTALERLKSVAHGNLVQFLEAVCDDASGQLRKVFSAFVDGLRESSTSVALRMTNPKNTLTTLMRIYELYRQKSAKGLRVVIMTNALDFLHEHLINFESPIENVPRSYVLTGSATTRKWAANSGGQLYLASEPFNLEGELTWVDFNVGIEKELEQVQFYHVCVPLQASEPRSESDVM